MNNNNNKNILVIIPARSGSKRIPNKNIRKFLGKPLIAYTLEQALSLEFVERVIVDTDSPKIAKIAKQYGAEVPFLRPAYLAKDTSRVVDSILYLLKRLKKEENYVPTYVMILQATSPLREIHDIKACWKLIKSTNATTILTVCPTHPRLYHLKKNDDIILVNGSEKQSSNMQAWPPAYILNGCFVYIIKTSALLKEKRIITKKTKAIVCPKWRSIDLDTPGEWVMAEVFYKNKDYIKKKIKTIK
ncbi:MAG: acylneuraminate cytidylyltransferase family protein [Nanoarchaeota archaeon]|nr:acylneuraminate cytidylyltransferase family protein [Nanoarchaeota archaeon]